MSHRLYFFSDEDTSLLPLIKAIDLSNRSTRLPVNSESSSISITDNSLAYIRLSVVPVYQLSVPETCFENSSC